MNARIRELKARLVANGAAAEDVEDLGREVIAETRRRNTATLQVDFGRVVRAARQVVATTDEESVIELRDSLGLMAPDMARLLLDVEWSGASHGHTRACPSCQECGAGCALGHPAFPHADDCALDAVLRKAGVR